MVPVAALFVDSVRGPYARMPGVEAWDLERDAMRYAGPHPVVAHPSCAPWGRFAWRTKGADSKTDGAKACGPLGVVAVRRWGGVLEHPAGSALWKAVGLPRPGEPPDEFGGWTLTVRQVDWGHMAEKRSWLYIVGLAPQDLPPMPPRREPTHVVESMKGKGRGGLPRMPKSQRHVTPPAFAEWLVEVARRTRRMENPPRGERVRELERAGADPWLILAERNRRGLPLVEVLRGLPVLGRSGQHEMDVAAVAVPGARLTSLFGVAGLFDGIAADYGRLFPAYVADGDWVLPPWAVARPGFLAEAVEDLTDVLRDELKARGLR